jgi:N-carbamoyl-L-amino-acid hydrolase
MTNVSDVFTLTINGNRLLQRQKAMAEIGATGRGGVNRQALSRADTEARKLLLSWTRARNFVAEADLIGNLFIRRPGTDSSLPPVMVGSHLDSQPTGGNFDGVFGVLAGLEALETLEDHAIITQRPAELVVWMNEEGSRFAPPTMGSAVSAGAMPLDTALATKDKEGISVKEALAAQLAALPDVGTRKLGSKGAAFIEAHIEQGPILETAGCDIGVVTGVQGICSFQVEIDGFEAHAGTTPVGARQDALVSAMSLIALLRSRLADPEDVLRFTVGRLEVHPGSPNTVPGRVTFTIDLRHPDNQILHEAAGTVAQICAGVVEKCTVKSRLLLHSDPVAFDPLITNTVRDIIRRRQIKWQDIVSGATHDALYMSKLAPTAMIFIPCEDGISHNEMEHVDDLYLLVGGQILCDAVVALLTAEREIHSSAPRS